MPGENSALEPLLDLAILQGGAAGAYVYRFNAERAGAQLAAFAGPEAAEPRLLQESAVKLHRGRRTPVVLHENASADDRFSAFPELQAGRFDGVISVPLLEGGEVIGIANFCRRGGAALSASALALLMSLSLPLGALLGAAAVREQLREALQELAERKVVKRAKGLLQSRFAWTEEEAYLYLRRSSRRRRTPMADLAREVIGGETKEEPTQFA
jgi:GAF domain-containing protein